MSYGYHDQEKLLKQTCATIQQLTEFAEKLADEIGEDHKLYKFLNYYSKSDIEEFWESSSAEC